MLGETFDDGQAMTPRRLSDENLISHAHASMRNGLAQPSPTSPTSTCGTLVFTLVSLCDV